MRYSFVLVAYASLAASTTLLQQLLACLNFTWTELDSEDLFCWYKKKWFLWTMAAVQAAENHGDEWVLTWYLQWGIYTLIPTWTHLQNSLAAAEALSLSSYGTCLEENLLTHFGSIMIEKTFEKCSTNHNMQFFFVIFYLVDPQSSLGQYWRDNLRGHKLGY